MQGITCANSPTIQENDTELFGVAGGKEKLEDGET